MKFKVTTHYTVTIDKSKTETKLYYVPELVGILYISFFRYRFILKGRNIKLKIR